MADRNEHVENFQMLDILVTFNSTFLCTSGRVQNSANCPSVTTTGCKHSLHMLWGRVSPEYDQYWIGNQYLKFAKFVVTSGHVLHLYLLFNECSIMNPGSLFMSDTAISTKLCFCTIHNSSKTSVAKVIGYQAKAKWLSCPLQATSK